MHTTGTTAAVRQSQKLRNSLLFTAGLLLASIGAALFAIFGLASWAEASAMHHAVQHVILFIGGVGVGGTGLSFVKRGK